MVPTRNQTVTRERENFPTEWALLYDNEYQLGQKSRQSEDARLGGRASISPLETMWRPVRQPEND